MAEGLTAMMDEVEGQPEALERFAKAELPIARRGSIFVGAGDSYAAALVGFYASGGRCIALDPYTLASEPETAAGLEVFFISVSGRTSSNVIAAKRLNGVAKRTTALTAVEESPLARSAGRVIRLPMAYVPRRPGMLSFSLTALAVLKLAGMDVVCDFRRMFQKAAEDRMNLSLGEGTTYFLGNFMAYPAALYAAAKVYEVLGAKAHPELLEEFSHLELFSLGKLDAVDVFAHFDPSGMGRKLAGALARRGYVANTVPSRGASPVERFFHSVFVSQVWVITQAIGTGLERPRFLEDERKLGASDSMIYLN